MPGQRQLAPACDGCATAGAALRQTDDRPRLAFSTMTMTRLIVASLLMASAGAPALATTASGRQVARDRTEGVWVFSEATDGAPDCKLILKPGQTIGGKIVARKGKCDKVRPGMDDAHAWFIRDDGALVIVDATRKPLISFERGGPKWFIRKQPDAQPLYLHFDD